MIAIDTNILVYAHRGDSRFSARAGMALSQLADGVEQWGIPWPCLHEFYAVVTASKSFTSPTPVELVRMQIGTLLKSPSLVMLAKTERHWSVLSDLLATAPVRGIKIHDAKIAAICIEHGVRELWSADRDFARFPQLKTVNPLRD